MTATVLWNPEKEDVWTCQQLRTLRLIANGMGSAHLHLWAWHWRRIVWPHACLLSPTTQLTPPTHPSAIRPLPVSPRLPHPRAHLHVCCREQRFFQAGGELLAELGWRQRCEGVQHLQQRACSG